MYIDGFERRDIYGYDKVSACLMFLLFFANPKILIVCLKIQEIVFSYWQKTAIDLICNKENRVRPNVRCALKSVQGDAVLRSVQGDAALAVVIAPQ